MSADIQYYDDGVLTDGHILTTTVTGGDNDSTTLTSSLDLNTVLGNKNGVFSWGGTNFSDGAQNVQLTNGCQLEADLPDGNGNMAHSMINITSVMVTDDAGQNAIQHHVAVVYSEAHAVADTNDQADSSVLSQAQTTAQNSSIGHVATVQGDASTYWPDGNAPASSFNYSKAGPASHSKGGKSFPPWPPQPPNRGRHVSFWVGLISMIEFFP